MAAPKTKPAKKPKIAPTTVPVPVSMAGIYHPILMHRFVVSPIVGMDNCPEISKQIVRIKYDLATKKGSMVVELPLPGCGVLSKLNLMMNGCSSLIIEATDGCGGVWSSTGLCNLTFTKCEVNHDYALSGTVTADIEFSFQTIITTTGVDGSEKIIENSHC